MEYEAEMIHQRCFESSESFMREEEQAVWWQKCPKSPAEVPTHTPHPGSWVALPSLPADLTAKLRFSKSELLGRSVEAQIRSKLVTSPLTGGTAAPAFGSTKGVAALQAWFQ